MGLFTPAWKSKNEKRALRAVEKMTDPEKLKRVEKEAKSSKVRGAALSKLINAGLVSLAEIAKSADMSHVHCCPVVKKMNDPYLLAEIAKNDSDGDLCMKAVEKLDDQTLLADVAKNTRHPDVRKIAFEKLTDIEDLKGVAEKYFADINALHECTYGDWQKVATLVSIAKKFPEILKENWSQIGSRIQMLHEDMEGYSQGHRGDSCHEDFEARNNTAASLGLHFPPYPFNDETNDKTDVKL